MTTSSLARPAIQWPVLLPAMAGSLLLWAVVMTNDGRRAALFVIGIGMGVSLYHATFGFTAAYRRAVTEGDVSGVIAQVVMLALAVLLFAPVLSWPEVFGNARSGALAPVSLSMGLGAFLFGIGMQVGGACASGTLYTAGGGSPRMILVLVFFCIGGFWASLHMDWWQTLPGVGVVSLTELWGGPVAVVAQLVVLGLIPLALILLGGRIRRPLWWAGDFKPQELLRGPWPLLLSAGLLTLFNLATLLIAGHPWSITWAFTLWAAKGAALIGWDPVTSPFWADGFPARALAAPVLSDTTSVMNFGIILGALAAAALAGKVKPKARLPGRSLAAAVLGGLMLGYGARLAYGCNIGAFFSGVASASLHGWVWIVCALGGTVIGIRLRRFFRLEG